jgi:hypothetical protein
MKTVKENSENKKMIAFQLETELYDKLVQQAEEEDRSISSLIRAIIKTHLKTNKENA